MAEPWSQFPGVYTSLQDTSIGPVATNGTVAFMCFMSEKGPDNQLVLNNGSVSGMLSTYGNVDIAKYGQGLKIALQYLELASSLYSIRVTPDHTNCAAMTNIYKDLYGSYSKSAIEMREAAFANLGIATNENGDYEFIHVGPEDLGEITSISTSVPPSTPKLNDRYYIPTSVNAMGTWQGHEGEVAICISEKPVVWAYKEIKDTSTATINGVEMCAAVTYEQLPSLALWREYENKYLSEGYTDVIDIIDELPKEKPNDGDKYLVCDNPTDVELASVRNKVIEYKAADDIWDGKTVYNKVFIERDYIVTDTAPSSVSVGDRFIVGDEPTTNEWVGHEREFAVKTNNSWKFLSIDVAEPEDTEKFQSVVLNEYIDSLTTNRIEYSRKNVFVKDIIWTADVNAKFVAYAHRKIQFNDIVDRATPDSSIEYQSLEPFVIFYPLGRGSAYNNIHIDMNITPKSIHEVDDFDKLMNIDIYDTTGGNKLRVESFEVSFNPNRKDLDGSSMFIADVINKFSTYVNVAINPNIFTEDALFCRNIHSDLELLFTKYSIRNKIGSTSLPPKFEHGDDGSIFDKYGNLDWEQATSLLCKAYTGTIINPFKEDQSNPYENDVLDTESKLFDLIFDAGYPFDVKRSILQLITSRHDDCFGIIDLGDNATPAAAMKERSEGNGLSFNSPYLAIYEPYSLIYDEQSGRDVWISPVFHAVRAYAITDRNYGMHNAPAGAVRGQCPQVKKLRYNLNRSVEYQNSFVNWNINPIIQNRDGYVIWGQSTSYLRNSRYQDINVTRMVLRIKRDLEFTLRSFIFEINDAITWALVSNAVNAYLGNLVSEHAIENYSVSVYASDYDIQKHRLRVDVTIQPKQVIYQILLQISV